MTFTQICMVVVVLGIAMGLIMALLFPPVKPLEKLYKRDKRKWLVTVYPIDPDMPMPGLMPITLQFAEEMVKNYPERCRIEER